MSILSPRRIASRSSAVVVLLLSVVAGCAEDDQPTSPPSDARINSTVMPVDSLIGDPPFLAIAAEVPTFAGFWYAGDRIEVALTDVADFDRVVPLIRPLLGADDAAGGFVAVNAQHSFIKLARIRTDLRRSRIFGVPGVVMIGVDEQNNRVHVGIEGASEIVRAESERRVLSMLDSLRHDPGSVEFKHTVRPRSLSHSLTSQHPDSAAEGGWKIWNYGANNCTLGFPAVRSDGTEVFVTNFHCTTEPAEYDGSAIKQPSSRSPILGYEILDPSPYPCDWAWSSGTESCRNADAALISVNSGVQFNLGLIGRTTQRRGCEGCSGDLTIDHNNPTITIYGPPISRL